MKHKFYGRRGSVPVCDAGLQEFGGNATCVRLTFPDTQSIAIIDTGSARHEPQAGAEKSHPFFLEFTALPHNICSKPHRHHGLQSRIQGKPGCLRICKILWPIPL